MIHPLLSTLTKYRTQVTADYKRTLTSLSALGISPWRIYTCAPHNTTAQTYHGQSSEFTLRFCYASLLGGMTYEVIQPVSGPTIFQEFLDKQGEGIHHIAYDCNGIAMEERVKRFRERGFECVQSGKWMVGGLSEFAFFENGALGTCFETIGFEEGWEFPEPDEWFPPDAGGRETK